MYIFFVVKDSLNVCSLFTPLITDLIFTYYCVCQSLSHLRLFEPPWTVACQVPLAMGFSRHEYWSGLPCPSPGDLPDPGIETGSPALQADYLPSEPPGKPSNIYVLHKIKFVKYLGKNKTFHWKKYLKAWGMETV